MILSAEQIRKRLELPFPDKLVITPLLEDGQLSRGAGSVDLRLGLNFVLADPAVLGRLDPLGQEQAEGELSAYLRPVYVALGGKFILHPRQFALAATMEYVRLPCGLAANVVGRSRWARVGLIIAMATYVHPCYSGCLTLEMQNLGDVPIELSPGLPIAQLILEEVAETEEKDLGQITCSTGPEFLPLLSDPDRRVLRRLRCTREEATGDRRWRQES
jgi:dCTP deaminase